MESNEKYRGQKDGIILFILSKGERHADELKIIIDEYFQGVKIGTLYSIIARLKSQSFVSEYRASSIDGSRRKYFKLTDKGLAHYTESYAQLFIDCNVELNKKDYSANIEEEAKPIFQTNNSPSAEEISTNEVLQPTDSASIYSNMINDSVLDNDFTHEIDFSSLENKESTTNETTVNIQKEDNSFIPYDYDTDLPAVKEVKEINQDSVLNSTYEYSSILSKMFPKKSNESENSQIEEVETNDISENVVLKEFSESQTDWNEVYDLAEKEGIKIRTSSDTNRYQGSKILLSKLLLCSTAITLVLAVLEYLILSAIIPNVPFSAQALLTVTSIFGSIFIIALINFLINPYLQVKNLPRFINLIEIALIITISTAIIAFSLAVIKDVNFSNNAQTFSSIILPIVLAFNLIILTIITYLLAKSDHFESL